MENQLATINDAPLTAVQVRANINLIQEVMKATMQDGQHYGRIPGCGEKPTLLKAGAEKILATFRIAVEPICEDLSFTDCVRYRVTTRAISPSGVFLGAGVGECSSDEEKYRWKAAYNKREFDSTPEDRRRIKYGKPTQWNKTGEFMQIRTNPADIANTVLKMAKKRALIDMTLTVTAASDIFTQDLEDLPEEQAEHEAQEKAPIQPPKRKSDTAKPENGNGDNISEAQQKRLWAIVRENHWTPDHLKKLLVTTYGIEHSNDIPRGKYDEIVNTIQAMPLDGDQGEAPNA